MSGDVEMDSASRGKQERRDTRSTDDLVRQEGGGIKSIDEAVRHYRLTDEFLSGELTQRHMLDVSLKLVDWRKFGRAADLNTAEIEEIQQDGRGEDDRRYKTIEMWHRTKASGATYRALIEILLSLKMVDIAEQVCGMQQSEGKERRVRNKSELDSVNQHSPSMAEEPLGAHNLRRTFHNTKHEGLSETEVKTKVRRLFLEATELSLKFSLLFSKLFVSMRKRSIPKEDLVICLIGLEMFSPIYESSKQPLFKDQKNTIAAAKDISHIWIIVKDYCSFFNTCIIEQVTEQLGTEDDQQRMLEYKQSFEEYAKRDLSDCPTVFGSMNDQDCTITVKLADSFDDCTANQIYMLQRKLCDILNVSYCTLRLCQAKRGCYELTFQAPLLIKDAFPLSKDQESRLEELGVIYLICGEYKFFSHNHVTDLGSDGDPRDDSGGDDAGRYAYAFHVKEELAVESAGLSKDIGGDSDDDSEAEIPEIARRTNSRLMEEIVVPHTSAPPPPVGDKRVQIDQLDNLIQTVFKGTKTLNRIQSVVFDTAYYTNENLLISAPTGSGKTNIAMLTVLHEIKNSIESGVIQKDKFKVIYVTPMKALAAEVVQNFGSRLAALGVVVRELTGDMQLSRYEIQNTQMIVTTPEKWDVVTRKSTGDMGLVKLLIIDEVHLLHEDRGAVIESLVARTLRKVESSQRMIRIVGLSATLPNYRDVAHFLRVKPHQGLFFFDSRYRPVPLSQTFIGVKTTNRQQQLRDMDVVCYDKVLANVRGGYQVLVFVHSRNGTLRTATSLRGLAFSKGDISLFRPEKTIKLSLAEKQISKSDNKPLRDLFSDGFSSHHAGMLRQDRSLVERLFSEGLIKVLVCTATLAWGVNLPAHAVIIKGTQIYDAKKSSFVDLGILDVLQMFGRAGRPQFDKFGEGTIITTHDKLPHYLSLLTLRQPIESRFVASLTDNLNAEIALGTVTNIDEAVQWLSYTFLYVRMRLNPLVYGVSHTTRETDPDLKEHRRSLVTLAAKKLDKAMMIRYVQQTGALLSTYLGRTASHYYIKYASIQTFNEFLKPHMNEGEIVIMVSKSDEFEQVKVRQDEISELEFHRSLCRLPVGGGVESSYGKVNILLQTYISRGKVNSFSLTSDLSYVAQNSGRILRSLFEITLRKCLPALAARLLTLCKCVEHQQWAFEHPLRQFKEQLSQEIIVKLEERRLTLSRLRDMSQVEIGHIVHHVRMGRVVTALVRGFPSLSLAATIQPISRTLLKVRLTITPEFEWNDRLHGMTSDPWWIWVEDTEYNHMLHSDYFLLQRKQVLTAESQDIVFTISIFEPLPPQYVVRAISDRWLGAEAVVTISLQHLILPKLHPPHTQLLDLRPLPVSALKSSAHESLFKFQYFNPMQSQVFHTLYHSDTSVLLSAPTCGKTVAAELSILRVFSQYPGGKAVYIAPLEGLVRERMDDWKRRLEGGLGKTVVELTGDMSPDLRAVERAALIVTTPEKWDGVSRSQQNRSYVQAVRVLIVDELHLLGDERGQVLEVILSRTNFIASHTHQPVRIVGLCTALANAQDLADWLGVKQCGLFNFDQAVRPLQLEVHIDGFPSKDYHLRMTSMNKPVYRAIKTHSPDKPVIVFVSSPSQTRLTAFDFVAFLATEDNPKQWLHMSDKEMDNQLVEVLDQNLKVCLEFGVGLYHAGLHERDRKTVEELFVSQKIQILIVTSALAWDVNFPAHLVVVKGTEYYDEKSQRYIDYPIADVLQMMGRAGRPQCDDKGVAFILVYDIKKNFYRHLLYEPFSVESNLLAVLDDHFNAEIVAGTITSKQDAMDYLTWTYFFRRLFTNPSFYQLKETSGDAINTFLSRLVSKSLSQLESSYCILFKEDGQTVRPLTLGCIASFYYLHHTTVRLFREKLCSHSTFEELLQLLCAASEYDELPKRHNEDVMNGTLAKKLPLPVSLLDSYDSPHSKALLLLQAHFSHCPLPTTDYQTDTKSVLDQALGILQALVDIAANEGWLSTTLKLMHLVQMCVQGRWASDSSLLTLPHVDHTHIEMMNKALLKMKVAKKCGVVEVTTLPELITLLERDPKFLLTTLRKSLSSQHVSQIQAVVQRLPIVCVTHKVQVQGRKLWAPTAPLPAGRELQERVWVEAPVEEECVVHVELSRRCLKGMSDSDAYAPKFPKAKDEGWWLVLGETDSEELLALKRIRFLGRRTQCSLAFSAPEEPCRKIYTLYLLSDCYLGLDQQFDLSFEFCKWN